jgi:hypothetical protein
MAINIKATIVQATKLADGNVRLDFWATNDGLNSNGQLRFAQVLTSADFTAFNTTVNGGATGTTLSKVYGEDANRNDYPLGFIVSV